MGSISQARYQEQTFPVNRNSAGGIYSKNKEIGCCTHSPGTEVGSDVELSFLDPEKVRVLFSRDWYESSASQNNLTDRTINNTRQLAFGVT